MSSLDAIPAPVSPTAVFKRDEREPEVKLSSIPSHDEEAGSTVELTKDKITTADSIAAAEMGLLQLERVDFDKTEGRTHHQGDPSSGDVGIVSTGESHFYSPMGKHFSTGDSVVEPPLKVQREAIKSSNSIT